MAQDEEKEDFSNRPYMSFGCDLIDLTVGGAKGVRGVPAGTIINFIGDKSAFKTFVKNEMIAASYHERKGKKFKWFSDDAESGDTFDTTSLYGFNIRPEERKFGGVVQEDSTTVEEMDARVTMFLNSLREDECGIYAIDSLDGLTDSNKEKMSDDRVALLKKGDDVKDKGDYGMQIPKFLSQHFFRGQHKRIKTKNALLVIVSQIRDNLEAGMFGRKWEVSGGKALEFFCHTRLFLRTITKIKKGDRVIGAVVHLETIKSKTKRPYRSCWFTVYFDYGIDNIGTSLDFLFDLRGKDGELLPSKVNSIAWDGKLVKNLENLREWLKTNNLDEACRVAKKEATRNSNLSVDFILEWVESSPEIKAKFDAHFGTSCSRDELIQKIENEPRLQRELRNRVIEKWEAQEDAVATNRKGKYV